MAKRNFNQSEQDIAKFWQDNKIFQKSVDKDAPQGDYVFYDGPPFATGLPHYGHIIGSVLKDVVPRYWTMRGFRVERKWGWDCHGLPIENLVEKELGLNSKEDIETIGIKKFNSACRSKVMMYADEWKTVINRLGRFVDMENDYKTMDKNYMESIWWVFKQLWDKELIYQSHKSMHVCPRCETTLSQSEVSQGYLTVKDLSVTAKFELLDEPNTFILAWTTTPWTLPGNFALAFGSDIKYVKVEHENQKFILAKKLLDDVFLDRDYKFIEDINIQDLIGKTYKPLFDYYKDDTSITHIENAYKIVLADFVTTEDGTGVVHIAPAFGEDDMKVGRDNDLPFVQHVSMDGRYKDEVTDWAGQEVKSKDDPTKADIDIIKYLAHKGLLFSKAKYEHTYPHCWRCDSPLLNYATNSWFVNITKIKDQMLEGAKDINWVPAHMKEGRFGQWLAGARDWSISRQRYWGSVMPIWNCKSCNINRVFGSIVDLENASGTEVTDLHKDIVDEITIECTECNGIMNRIPDVLDCWFESGSMPYAQMHYPFENKEKFERNFPAQYIAEGVDQTRAWFYYMHALSIAIMGKAAFENVVVNGILLAEDGKKMSKKLQNYPDPMEMMSKYGADAMRLYLMTSTAVQAEDLRFSEKGVDEVFKKVMMIWWNVYSFYGLYANDDLLKHDVKRDHVLDQWVIMRLNDFVSEVTHHMNEYDLLKASRLFVDFVSDISTWYVRRSRDRFKIGTQDERAAAVQTLHEVLFTASKVMCPFIPFMTEDIYLALKSADDAESVHLCEWPESKEHTNDELLEQMKRLRNVVELALSIRSTQGVKVRQALSSLQISGITLDTDLLEVLKDEINVKSIDLVDNIAEGEYWVRNSGNGLDVSLNIEITENLRKEGIAREMIRHINLLRKDLGFTMTDTAKLLIQSDNKEIVDSIKEHIEMIKKSTQTVDVTFDEKSLSEAAKEIKINGELFLIDVQK